MCSSSHSTWLGVVVTDRKAVAMKTDSVTCEFEGVLLGIKLTLDFFRAAVTEEVESVLTFSVTVLM